MTLEQEQELLEKSRSIVSAYDTQPSPEGVAAAASAIRSGGGPQAAHELQSETAELSSAMSTGLTISQQASDFSDPSSSNDQNDYVAPVPYYCQMNYPHCQQQQQ